MKTTDLSDPQTRSGADTAPWRRHGCRTSLPGPVRDVRYPLTRRMRGCYRNEKYMRMLPVRGKGSAHLLFGRA
jgi:hypothetical protein